MHHFREISLNLMLCLSMQANLKCGFRKKSFVMNALGLECTSSQLSISVITFGWVQRQTHPKLMTDMLN